MTAETIKMHAGEDRSSLDPPTEDRELWQGVESLEASIHKLDPYRRQLDSIERLRHWRSLCQLRGRRYVKANLDSYKCTSPKQSVVLNRLRDFAKHLPERLSAGEGGVVLLGPPGTGKDHLLMGLMRVAVLNNGFTVRWVDGMRLFAQIKAGIRGNKVETLLDELCSVSILALSDPVPPRDELTAYEMAVLRDIIERRYSHAMATWITTNVQTSEDAKKLFTAAVLDRLMDGATQLFCDWESHRRPTS